MSNIRGFRKCPPISQAVQELSLRIAPWALLALCIAAGPAAAADCKAVQDAMEKSFGQERTAMYEVEDDKSPPTADGDYTVRIGKRRWQSVSGRTFEGKEADPALETKMLRERTEAMNRTGCEALGAGTYRGAAVMRYRFPNLAAQGPLPMDYLKQRGLTEKQVRTFLLYVDKASGLPVYSETFNVTGVRLAYAYAYGDAVKEPASAAVAKGRK